MAELKIILFK